MTPIGTCSLCAGPVFDYPAGVSCLHCGAVAALHGPVIPMVAVEVILAAPPPPAWVFTDAPDVADPMPYVPNFVLTGPGEFQLRPGDCWRG